MKCRKGERSLGAVCISKKIFKDKTRTGFDIALTFYSLFGFLAIILLWISSLDISLWAVTVLMISSGIAFMYEGQVQNLRRMFADGRISGNEFSNLITIIIGALAIIVGILSIPLFELSYVTLDIFTGIIALIAFIVIIIQTWVVN